MAVTLHLVGGIENSAQQEAKQAMKKLPEMLHPRVPHDSQHFVRDSKMGIPSSSTALHDQTLSQKQIEVGLAFLKEYNKNMEHAEVIDQAEVLKCLEKDDISGLEALVVEHNKPLISAKRMNLATLLNLVYGDKNARDMINTFTKTFKSSSIKRKGMKVAATQPFKNSHQLLDKRSTPVTEETKSLTRYGYTWPDPVLTEAFAAYSPHINQFQLTEWKNQGKLAEDMVEKLSNYPHEEAIRDGSLLKAFVAYIDLWNIKLSPKELNLFESLKTQFGDYVAARLIISGKYGSDTNLASICASLENMHASDMADRKLTPHDTLILFKLKNQDSFPEEILAYWCRSVRRYPQNFKTGSAYSYLAQHYTDQFKLAKMLDAYTYESDVDWSLKNLLKNQAENWCDKGENQESILKLLHFDIKRLDLFELPINSWLAFLRESSQRHPDLMHYSIGSLKNFYTEQELATFITNGLKNPETESVAAKLKVHLLRHWFNDLKSPQDDVTAFHGYEHLRSDYLGYWKKVGYGNTVAPSDQMRAIVSVEKFEANLFTVVTTNNIKYGTLLQSFANFVAHVNSEIRVETLDLFALLFARFGQRHVADILTSGDSTLIDRTITRAQNSQIQFWIRKKTLLDDVIKSIKLDNENEFTYSRLKLFLMYISVYNDTFKSNTVMPYSVLEKYYHPLILASLLYELPKSSELEKLVKQVEIDLEDFFERTDLPPETMFGLLPSRCYEKKEFDQITRLWLESGTKFHKDHPSTTFEPIRILNTVHDDGALIDMILMAAKDNDLKHVAEVLKRDLWSKWTNDWKHKHKSPDVGTSNNVKSMVKDYRTWLNTIRSSMRGNYRLEENVKKEFERGIILDEALRDGVLFQNIVMKIEELNKNHIGEPLGVYAILETLFDVGSVFRLAYPIKVEGRSPHFEAVIEQLQVDQARFWFRTPSNPAKFLDQFDLDLDSKSPAALVRFKAFVQHSLEYNTEIKAATSTLEILRARYDNNALDAFLREASGIDSPNWEWKNRIGKKINVFQIMSDPNKASLNYAWMQYMFVQIMNSPRQDFWVGTNTIGKLRISLSDKVLVWLIKAMYYYENSYSYTTFFSYRSDGIAKETENALVGAWCEAKFDIYIVARLLEGPFEPIQWTEWNLLNEFIAEVARRNTNK
ncbi:hypothetical protein Plhal304r1_c060g0146161 [Plasmopara halstedii]